MARINLLGIQALDISGVTGATVSAGVASFSALRGPTGPAGPTGPTGSAAAAQAVPPIKGFIANGSAASSVGWSSIGAVASASAITGNTFVVVNPTTTDNVALAITTAGGAGSACAMGDNTATASPVTLTTAATAWVKSRVALSRTTNITFFTGVSNFQQNLAAGTNPNTSVVAAFRFAAGTDTNWQAYTSNGAGASTVTNTGVAADTNPHTFLIVFNGGSSIDFWIDGTKVASGVTGNIPTTSTLLSPFAQASNPSAGSLQMNCYYLFWQSNN